MEQPIPVLTDTIINGISSIYLQISSFMVKNATETLSSAYILLQITLFK